MKKYLFVLLIVLFSSLANAGRIQIHFPEAKVKQGSLQKVTLSLDEEAVQQVQLQKLKGQTLSEILYVQNVSTMLRRDSKYEADATVIFVKVPQSNQIVYKTGTTDVTIGWSKVEIIPTEAPKELLFGQFEIPERAKLFRWFIGLVVLIAGTVGFFKIRKKFAEKKAIKTRKLELKDEIMSAKDYDQVVSIWQSKAKFIQTFPALKDPFKDLETVLFKYQFKQRQNETEKIAVMNAYREFTNKIQGGFDGI